MPFGVSFVCCFFPPSLLLLSRGKSSSPFVFASFSFNSKSTLANCKVCMAPSLIRPVGFIEVARSSNTPLVFSAIYLSFFRVRVYYCLLTWNFSALFTIHLNCHTHTIELPFLVVVLHYLFSIYLMQVCLNDFCFTGWLTFHFL